MEDWCHKVTKVSPVTIACCVQIDLVNTLLEQTLTIEELFGYKWVDS